MTLRPTPPLRVPTLTHGSYVLTGDTPQNFALVVFYRGRIAREFRKGQEEITTVKLLAAIEGETAETVS